MPIAVGMGLTMTAVVVLWMVDVPSGPVHAPRWMHENAVAMDAVSFQPRLWITPILSASINDLYYQHWHTGLALHWQMRAALALGVRGGLFLQRQETLRLEQMQRQHDVIPAHVAAPRWWLSSTVDFRVWHGKMRLLPDKLLYFNTYLGAGLGWLQPRGQRGSAAMQMIVGWHVEVPAWRVGLVVDLHHMVFVQRVLLYAEEQAAMQHLLFASIGLRFALPFGAQRGAG